MTDPTHPTAADGDADDPVLAAAGARLRRQAATISPTAVQVAVLRRRSRRAVALGAAAVVVAALLAGALVIERGSADGDGGGDVELADDGPGGPPAASVDRLLDSLPDQPVDPTRVQLVASVSTFADCDALIGDLRQVGAQHVGSRGFGGFGDQMVRTTSARAEGFDDASATSEKAAPADADAGTTLGTNVQVDGVDELDHVKAAGKLIFDLDGQGNLRITDTEALAVLSTLDVTPAGPDGEDDEGFGAPRQVDQLLVADGRVALFGTEVEVSEPVEGDPSATRASTSYLTVTFVDATDPAAPEITDRVRVEGSLVSARLVDGEVRLVTTAHMADLGFVMPTTPNSVARALEQNRRSVATSTSEDWIPAWQRGDEAAEPLVPCERVHVPDTFSGVAMTSMVTFPLGSGRFEPAGTSILAPATTLYAGLDKVAISSEVWVDPVDQERLEFEDWETAVHEFSFTEGEAPGYEGSGTVDGSTVGQFAFGEVGGSLAVVSTAGTPWKQDPKLAIDLTLLTPDGDGGLAETGAIADLADGKGAVTAVRFVPDRVLISTGAFGREVLVIDVTDPAAPRRAGRLTLSGQVGYFHPLPDHRALAIGSRSDEVGEGRSKQSRSWVQAQLLDVSDPDAPVVLSAWERPWVTDQTAYDHHAFTYWPDRQLALWGLADSRYDSQERSNQAIVLGTDGALAEVAVPVANKPDEVPSPCPTVEVTDPDARNMVGPGGVVLRCDDAAQREVTWPRYQCFRVDDDTVARFVPEDQRDAAFFLCSPAPPPTVSRVLVVDGKPILLTDQTLEVLDPQTFASTSVTYHPTSGGYGYR